MKTKALVFPSENRYVLSELTIPEPSPEEMCVRTLVSAISPGTERWILRGKHIGTRFPCVPGYHRIGIVESVGAGVKEFDVGDIVYGSGNRWEEEDIHNMWGAHVGHSVSGPAGYTFLGSSLPDSLELDRLSFAILVAVANRGVNFLGVGPQEKVLILGAGIIGLCAAQLSALQCAYPTLLEKDPNRRAVAARLGIPALAQQHGSGSNIEAMAPDGFDALYDTTGDPSAIDAMVPKVKRGGRLLLQAQYFDNPRCAIDLDAIKVREITIRTTCGQDSQDMQDAITNIRTRRVQITPLITHRFDAPGDLLKGYDLLDTGLEFNLGMVFRWGNVDEA